MQMALNKLNDNLVNIGKFKFDETEWAVLQKQQQDVEKIREKLIHGTDDPGQVLTPLQLPGGNPIDLQPVMAEELYRPRRFWEMPDMAKSTKYFLENDQNSRAFLDAATGETGKSANDIIGWIIGGRNPNRFDSKFQGFLDTAMVGHDTGVIDEKEYPLVMQELVRSLHDMGVSMNRLIEVNKGLLDEGIPIHGKIIGEIEDN
jgi:hypothetical protein